MCRNTCNSSNCSFFLFSVFCSSDLAVVGFWEVTVGGEIQKHAESLPTGSYMVATITTCCWSFSGSSEMDIDFRRKATHSRYKDGTQLQPRTACIFLYLFLLYFIFWNSQPKKLNASTLKLMTVWRACFCRGSSHLATHFICSCHERVGEFNLSFKLPVAPACHDVCTTALLHSIRLIKAEADLDLCARFYVATAAALPHFHLPAWLLVMIWQCFVMNNRQEHRHRTVIHGVKHPGAVLVSVSAGHPLTPVRTMQSNKSVEHLISLFLLFRQNKFMLATFHTGFDLMFVLVKVKIIIKMGRERRTRATLSDAFPL